MLKRNWLKSNQHASAKQREFINSCEVLLVCLFVPAPSDEVFG